MAFVVYSSWQGSSAPSAHYNCCNAILLRSIPYYVLFLRAALPFH
jgi:hypothetical protein